LSARLVIHAEAKGLVRGVGLNEADTRSKLIDPKLHARGWTEDLIKREETAGAIEIVGGVPRRQSRGRTDYTLRVKVHPGNQPVAVALIEAKSEDFGPDHGLQQAKLYASCQRLNVPIVFSTNGYLFVEFDRKSGQTTTALPLSLFPSPAELRERYESLLGIKLSDPAAKPLLVPYPGGEATRRYYQDAAIRAVLEKLVRCEKLGEAKRALLALATGSGKTFIAVNLLRRISDAGQLHRALFICDRDELRLQAANHFQVAFGADAARVTSGNPQKNARVLIATYQTLGIDRDEDNESFLVANYPENFFSHIVIDECHRSAWGTWSEVLRRNPNAVQIGLTATPRQLVGAVPTPEASQDARITADNVRYFGEPVYEYDIAQGIEDGYLAACEIRRGRVSIDDRGVTVDDILARNPVNPRTGELVTRGEIQDLYDRTQFEDKILLPDRVLAMCQDLFQFLLETGGPEQKSIVFCVRDQHADSVANQMNNLYGVWCQQNGKPRVADYAFKCTAASFGSDYLADFKGLSSAYFIATTVDLLTTGVDVPAVRNIAFFKYVRSPIAFYQMIGRGTRLDPPTNKLMFRVYDYTNATRLFGEAFLTRLAAPRTIEPRGHYDLAGQIEVAGFDVHRGDAGRYILTNVDGRAMPVTLEDYRAKLAAELVIQAPTLDDFRSRWIMPADRRELISHLPDAGRSAALVRTLDDMTEYDLYDVLGQLGYGLNAKTRDERANAFSYKHADWLKTLPPQTSAALRALADQFAKSGVEGLENRHVFQMPEVSRAGGLAALQVLGEPQAVLSETKRRLFAA
jgi:type I restriction enzyme, R subunit